MSTRVRIGLIFTAVLAIVWPASADAEQLIVTWKKPQPHAATASRKTQLVVVQQNQLSRTIKTIQNNPQVADVELNRPVYPYYAPNDSLWSSQWAPTKIGADTAWTYGIGAQVPVAVIDSGIDLTHPDLKYRLWVNPGEIAGNKKDDDHNGLVDDVNGASFVTKLPSLADGLGHGTHVSGIIAGQMGNGVGVAGAAPSARIMTLRIFDAKGGGGTLYSLVGAIDYAVAKGAKIINASLGCQNCYSSAVEAAIQRAQAAGVLVIAAAGNNAANNDAVPAYPSGYPENNVVSVASTDSNDAMSSFSNYGTSTVDMAAPGGDILSTIMGGKWGSMSGTSMAAPYAAGAAAWLWGMKPSASYSEIRDALINGGDTLGDLSGKTASSKRLSMTGALNMILPGAVLMGDPQLGPAYTAAPSTVFSGGNAVCNTGSWPAGTNFAYNWRVDGVLITGKTAVGQTLKISSDYSKPIACKITASSADGSSTTVQTTAPSVPAPLAIQKPSLKGTVRVGKVLSCLPGTWTYGPITFAYSWTRAGQTISANNTSSYTLTSQDAGQSIGCVVTASSAYGATPATVSVIA